MSSITAAASLPDPDESGRVLREFARLLAPYVAEELRKPGPGVSHAWDEATCRRYASRLSVPVAERALVLFEALAEEGKISSVELAKRSGVNSPKALAGFMTTSLKKHASKLGLPLPFDGGEGSLPFGGIQNPAETDDRQRTYWVDRGGIARRMVDALNRRIEEAAPKPKTPRFAVTLQHDGLPSMGMGGDGAEALKRRLLELGATPDDAIGQDAIYARFEVAAADEEQATSAAIELFDQALEDVVIVDAYGVHPTVRVIEEVERID